jgi:hypothetical protein
MLPYLAVLLFGRAFVRHIAQRGEDSGRGEHGSIASGDISVA